MGRLNIQNLGKAYKVYPSRWHRLAEMLAADRFELHEKRWVLRNVNFAVRSGEAVGIVGMNGAGKSTLLKLITGTTVPTEGRISVDGRVAAILELGIGFHPEFSGRQNITIGGMLLGISGDEIARAIPDVERFAEIGDYIDRPVRTYSSGMHVRLAFSVATAIRPDILIVDEALSVGDMYFQHKSFRRIREFRDAGTTILFVSHDPSAVKILCNRALLLDQGRVAMDDRPDAVLDYYNALIAARENRAGIRQVAVGERSTMTRSGSGEATIESVETLDADGRPARLLSTGQMATVRVQFRANASLDSLVVGLMIKDRLGLEVFGTNSYYYGKAIRVESGTAYVAEFRLQLNLGPGSYGITVALTGAETHLEQNFDWVDSLAAFDVMNRAHNTFVGTAYLPTEVTVGRAH